MLSEELSEVDVDVEVEVEVTEVDEPVDFELEDYSEDAVVGFVDESLVVSLVDSFLSSIIWTSTFWIFMEKMSILMFAILSLSFSTQFYLPCLIFLWFTS